MTTIDILLEKLIKKNEKLSKAKRVRTLIEMQKGLVKKKQTLTNFIEPVLFLIRRDGRMEMYEKATAGKFVFEHSNGKSRYIELRPSDQVTFDYGDTKVRSYVAHEDRPYAGWDEPVVDSESVMLGYEKTKATDLKYQQRIEELKIKSKRSWIWILLGIACAGAVLAFAYNTWIVPSQINKAQASATLAKSVLPLFTLKFRQRFK